MFSQLTHIKSDPLDVLLFGVGVRLAQLAKSDNKKFTDLLENRNFTIQLGSDAEGINRYYSIKDGKFSQTSGEATNPTLTITFKDSMTGAKLLTKGDVAAFMTGIQNGDLKMSGDYSLLMWFNQISKFIVPKVPEALQPVVEHAKPLLEKALPLAQGVFAKVQSFLGGDKFSENSQDTKKSKYFDAQNVKDVTNATSTESKLDTLKAKATELKEEVGGKLDDLKSEAKEKLETLKEESSDKLEEAKTKLEDAKEQASTKLADVKEMSSDKLEMTKAKVEEVKQQADSKLDELNEEAKEKLSDAKQKVEEKTADLPSLDELKAQAENKLRQVSADQDKTQNVDENKNSQNANELSASTTTVAKVSDINSSDIKPQAIKAVDDKPKTTEILTPAAATTQHLKAKHADDEVIAENVVTKAVQDDKSPITNISVTRNDDKSDTNGKPAIVVQDKDGNAYKSK